MNWFSIPNFDFKGKRLFLKNFVLKGMKFILLVDADLKG